MKTIFTLKTLSMLKTLSTLMALIVLIAITSGCSTINSNARYVDKEEKTIKIVGSNLQVIGSFKPAYLNRATYAGLQAAAEATLASGNQYFAIIKPASLADSLDNTAKEFIDRCSASSTMVFLQGNGMYKVSREEDPCGIHSNQVNFTYLTIEVYSEQPYEKLTYNAQEVITYLKSNDMYEKGNSISHIRK